MMMPCASFAVLFVVSCLSVQVEGLALRPSTISTAPPSLTRFHERQDHGFSLPVGRTSGRNSYTVLRTSSAASVPFNDAFPPAQPLVQQQPTQAEQSSSISLSSFASTASSQSTAEVLSPIQSLVTRVGLAMFIIGMCLALPLTLLPELALYKLGLISRIRKERWALLTSCWCARNVLRLVPFCRITATNKLLKTDDENPVPTVWVCNHISMLDVFLLLAADKKLRGKNRRPIKIVYWKQLEDHPITRLVFKQCGFIPVAMADNGHGTANEYDKSTFKTLLKSAKAALAEGFDLGILPEGQLNPTPEKGVLPVFTGAFTLARMSKRPIRMMAMHGAEQLWHPIKGLWCAKRNVKIAVYPPKQYAQSDEFVDDFETVVGHFGKTGQDYVAPPPMPPQQQQQQEAPKELAHKM